MSTSVELEGRGKGNDPAHVILRFSLCQLLLRNVEVRHVGGVVLGVVDLHDFSGNRGFECIVVVGEVREGVLEAGDQLGRPTEPSVAAMQNKVQRTINLLVLEFSTKISEPLPSRLTNE